jgi:hypothetical protein
LQIDRSARACGGNDKFHRRKFILEFEFNPVWEQ